MSPGDLQQLEDDVAQLLGAAGLARSVSERAGGFSLTRFRHAIRVGWAVDPTFDEMALDYLDDPDHPMVRFELDVVNAMLSAFAEMLVKAGYTVKLRLPAGENRDLLLDVVAGPNLPKR